MGELVVQVGDADGEARSRIGLIVWAVALYGEEVDGGEVDLLHSGAFDTESGLMAEAIAASCAGGRT